VKDANRLMRVAYEGLSVKVSLAAEEEEQSHHREDPQQDDEKEP
jgi:hypothetical protein